MSRATRIQIDLAALAHNIGVLKGALSDQKMMAVIKADAYGHGATAVAQHIAPLVDACAVAFTEEAVALREAGIECPILVMEGPHTESDVALSAKLDFWIALHDPLQIEWCKPHAHALPQVWLKADTGMHRLGFTPESLETAASALTDMGVNRLVLMSHLASAEYPQDPLTQSQIGLWQRLVKAWHGETSLCNSAATRNALFAHCDWVRVGYALYGGQSAGMHPLNELRPAMHFSTAVIALRRIARGETVGYGGRWRAERDSVIATLPVGYGDGYPWSAPDGTPVCIEGQIAPIAGRVSMDMMTVDVTDCQGIGVGSPATLWGDSPTIDEVARHSGTIGYELMTRTTSRPPRGVLR